MNRPPLEVADIVRCAGQSFIERSRKWINGQHEKVLLAITRCRTAALGGHRDQCSDCGHSVISYNMPQPALPQVSGQRPPALASGAEKGKHWEREGFANCHFQQVPMNPALPR